MRIGNLYIKCMTLLNDIIFILIYQLLLQLTHYFLPLNCCLLLSTIFHSKIFNGVMTNWDKMLQKRKKIKFVIFCEFVLEFISVTSSY